MSATVYRCRECHAVVVPNYDHVGDCERACDGTFSHPRQRCVYAGGDIDHGHVFKSTLPAPEGA